MRKWTIHDSVFRVIQGDITAQDTDAVVNAANKELAPGGGVAGAIHREAGQDLTEHCSDMGRCETGEAVITPGFDLEAHKIIHTVGPVYDSDPDPEASLRSSYNASLELAEENEIESVSFPLLSTGAFGYPMREASQVAIEEIQKFLETSSVVQQVRMVLWGTSDYEEFSGIATEELGDPDTED